MRRGEQRVLELGRSSSVALRSSNPAGMHSFGRRLEHARRHRPVAMAGKNQPRQHPRYSAARSDIIKAIEHAFDVRLFRAGPSFEKLRLEIRDAAHNHRFDQTLAAAKVMQDRGMRDAGVGGDFLKSNCLRTAGQQAPFCRFEDRFLSLRRASTPSSPCPVPDGAVAEGGHGGPPHLWLLELTARGRGFGPHPF